MMLLPVAQSGMRISCHSVAKRMGMTKNAAHLTKWKIGHKKMSAH
jgi:hypothetical protein